MEAKQPISLRVAPGDLAVIDRLAASHGLSRNEYMTRCSLGEPLERGSIEERVSTLEQRFSRLEEMAYHN